MKKFLLFILLLPCALSFAKQEVWYEYSSGLGADGYDVVSYFTEQKAVRGQADINTEYDGKTWYFSNSENKKQFLADPEEYLPQYGGHCAYAASLNAQAFGDPQVWSIHDDKLYFNYSPPVRSKWLVRVDERVDDGDRYWKNLLLSLGKN